MIKEKWSELIVNAVENKDTEMIEMLSLYMEEAEQAKQELRNNGYGYTGLSLLLTVKNEVPTKK